MLTNDGNSRLAGGQWWSRARGSTLPCSQPCWDEGGGGSSGELAPQSKSTAVGSSVRVFVPWPHLMMGDMLRSQQPQKGGLEGGPAAGHRAEELWGQELGVRGWP